MNARILYAAVPLALLLATGANAQSVYHELRWTLTQDQQTTVYRTIVRENAVPQMRPVSRKTTRADRSHDAVGQGRAHDHDRTFGSATMRRSSPQRSRWCDSRNSA